METPVKMARVGEIELFRFVFSIVILCRHAYNLLGENLVFAGGAFGVEFFFLVSGYLMAASIEKKRAEPIVNLGRETVGFVLRKAKAVWPEVMISFALALTFQFFAKRLSLYDTAKMLMQSFFELFLVQRTGVGSNSVNPVIWYIQSMLLCMMILYPLIRRFPEIMKWVVMPLTAFLLMGYLVRNYNHFRDPSKWIGFTYKGNVRAMAELCFGASLYPAVEWLKGLKLRPIAKVLLSCIKWSCWLLVIAYMFIVKTGFKQDAFMLVVLGTAVALAFSGQCADARLYQTQFVMFLGKFSLSLYLNHIYYANYLNNMGSIASWRYREKFVLYVFCAFSTALVVMVLAQAFRRFFPKLCRKTKTFLLC